MPKIGRNDLCPCGSGKKNKVCCGPAIVEVQKQILAAEQLNEMGNRSADSGNLTEAIACYERAVSIRPDFAGAWNNLGIALRNCGMPGRAISCYRQAIALQPAYAGAWNNLGCLFRLMGRYDEALDCFRSACKAAPDSHEVNSNLGDVLYDLGRYDEAIPYLDSSVQVVPDQARLYRLAHAMQAADEAVTASTISKVEATMKLDEIKEIARQHGIKIGKLKKAELIQAIQQAEANEACFESGQVDSCGQDNCLWREDCQ